MALTPRLPATSLLALLAAIALICGSAAGSAERSDVLPAASSAEHIWFLADAPTPGGAVELCHHAPAPDGPYVEALMTLPRRPEALAAWGDELWLVFTGEPAARDRQREVYGLRVRRHPVHGGYETEPRNRLDLLGSLPGEGKLAGFAGSARGPVALLVPPQRAGAAVRASEEAAASEPVLQQPLLVQWSAGQWTGIELPGGFQAGTTSHLAAGGADGEVLFIVAGPDSAGEEGSRLLVRDPSGSWSLTDLSLEAGHIRSLTRAGSQLAAVIASARDERCQLAYVRPKLLLPLAAFDRPALPWTALGLRDGLRIVACGGLDSATIQPVDGLTGHLGERRSLGKKPADIAAMLRMPLLLAITVFVLVMVIRFRPAGRPPVSLPAGHMPLPPLPRLGALVLDMVPGGVVAMLVFSCRPADLFGLPLMTTTFEDSVPYILMASITLGHSTFGELLWQRSLGKAMVGANIVAADGCPPGMGRILLRNLTKYLIVLIPPLAVLALMDPNLQGLDDLAGRTVVVRKAAGSDGADSKDR